MASEMHRRSRRERWTPQAERMGRRGCGVGGPWESRIRGNVGREREREGREREREKFY